MTADCLPYATHFPSLLLLLPLLFTEPTSPPGTDELPPAKVPADPSPDQRLVRSSCRQRRSRSSSLRRWVWKPHSSRFHLLHPRVSTCCSSCLRLLWRSTGPCCGRSTSLRLLWRRRCSRGHTRSCTCFGHLWRRSGSPESDHSGQLRVGGVRRLRPQRCARRPGGWRVKDGWDDLVMTLPPFRPHPSHLTHMAPAWTRSAELSPSLQTTHSRCSMALRPFQGCLVSKTSL